MQVSAVICLRAIRLHQRTRREQRQLVGRGDVKHQRLADVLALGLAAFARARTRSR